MRWRRSLVVGCGIGCALIGAVVLAAPITGCGNRSSAPRAGSEPLPSSRPPMAVPSGDRGGPMFAGPATGDRRSLAAGYAGSPMIEEARRRETAAERLMSEDQIRREREARGRAIAADMERAAASEAREPGSDECAASWAAQQALRDQLPSAGGASREDYLRACRAMPEADRRCMSPVYFRQHMQECAEVQAASQERVRRQGHLAAGAGHEGRQPTITPDVAGDAPPPAEEGATGADGTTPTPTPTATPTVGPVRVPMPADVE
jgi:hypothetical protein